MKTLIIDGLFIYKDLTQCFEGKTSLDIIFEQAKKNDISRFILLQNGKIKNIPDGIKNIVLKKFNPGNIINHIFEESRNSDDIIICNAGNPFFDNNFLDKMIKRHEKYLADYTYGLGYPNGLLPCIVKKSILKELVNLVQEDEEIYIDYIFHAISKDINSFDIETFLSDYDLRIYRINFGLNDIGEELFTKKIYNELNKNFSVENIILYLNNNIHQIYTTIYFLILEITNISKVKSIYYPEIDEKQIMMNFELIKKIINDLKSINEKATVLLGGFGDPLEHDNFIEILNYIQHEKFNTIIETYGTKIDSKFIELIKNIDKDTISFIIKVDAYQEETYNKIHKNGNFNDVINSVKLLKENGFKVYKQIIRMMDNEVEIEKYVRKNETNDLIIRKYSKFCDSLPDKKVVDLSPLKRIPCFHLRRELFIKADGSIPACTYSRNLDTISNINDQNINEIKNKLNELYINNAQKKYLNFCKNCDDYYIFNF